jgi:hypothetical protein
MGRVSKTDKDHSALRTRRHKVAKSKRSLVLCITLTLLGLLAGAGHLFGQVERARITGIVTDKSGAAVQGATVSVVNEATNQTITLNTDAAGAYTANDLNPGAYTITVAKQGYAKHINRQFTVQVSQVARLDVTLEVGSVTQTVEVTTTGPVLQDENATVGQVISPTAVAELPLNGRNLSELAVLAPGVTGLNYAPTNTIGSGVRPDELRPGGTTIEANGARDSANKMLLDGIDNTEMIAQTEIVRPSIDALQEFNVITSNAGAEYNRGGGAIVVTSTKQGSNSFHGSAYEYIRNSAVDAKNYFVVPGAPNPRYQLNDFGGRIGGPIKRDKAFFFVNYEGYYERAANTQVSSVPTLAMRNGDFRGVAHIYDPTTTDPVTHARQEFSYRGNLDVIDPAKMDLIAFALVNAYPLPDPGTGVANNLTVYPLKASDDNRGDARLDYQLSPSQRLFGRYSVDDTEIQMPNTLNSVIGGNENSFSGPQADRGQQGVIDYNKSVSSSLVGDYRFGFSRFTSFLLPSVLTSPIWSQIPGRLPLPGYQPPGAGSGPVAPIISPSGYFGEGNSRGEPQIRREHMWENIATIMWQKGTHSIRFGTDIMNYRISESDTPPGQSPFGRFNFDSNFTNNPLSPGGTGNTIASMLVGYPSTTARDFFLPGTAHVNTNEYNFFIADDWRVAQKLVINAGLHYEIDTPFSDSNDHWVNFNPATAAVEIAGQNGVSNTGNWNTDYSSVGPRIGIAFTPDQNTVFRVGYGIFYDPQGNFGTTIRQGRQWPFDLVYATAPGSFFPANRVSDGFLTPSQLTATFATPFGTLKGIDQNFKNASTQQFNLSMQRQLSATSSFTIGYVGALTHGLSWSQPIDQPTPGPGNIQARRPFYAQFPNVTAIAYYQSVGVSLYNSLQTSFQQRLRHGFFLTANYVWSHAKDDSPFDGGADGPIPQNPLDRAADYADSDNDIRNRLSVYTSYELPFGTGKALLNGNSFLEREVVAGWRVNLILVAQSGLPFTVTMNGTSTNTGAGSSRVDRVVGANPYPAQKSIQQWFNPSAFFIPPAYQYGTEPRNSLRGPRETNADLSLEKQTALPENTALLFRIEAFNVLNHPQFVIPAATINAAGAGAITATSNTARQLQAAVRFTF